jgi:hypothetical protein
MYRAKVCLSLAAGMPVPDELIHVVECIARYMCATPAAASIPDAWGSRTPSARVVEALFDGVLVVMVGLL